MTAEETVADILSGPSHTHASLLTVTLQEWYARGLADGRQLGEDEALIARCERAEAKLLKPSPISYDDLIQCPEKCAEYLKLHDAIIEDDDGIRTCADGTKRQTDRRLGYSLCWPHGVMLIGHKGCYPRAEKWAALFIYFWKYHKVPCDVLDEMLGELTGIHYVMEQRDEAIATAKEAHARIGAAIARAERAEREAKEARADATVLADEVRKWRAAFSTWNANPKPNAFFHDPHRAIDATDASGALTRNSAGGGLEHERGAGTAIDAGRGET